MHRSRVRVTFDWEEYYKLAQELSGVTTVSSNIVAKFRCSISRAYYAAYCLARNHLRDVDGIPIPKKHAHTFVIKQYTSHANIVRKRIGTNLNRMKKRRVKADYKEVFHGDLPRITQDSVQTTKDILDDLKLI